MKIIFFVLGSEGTLGHIVPVKVMVDELMKKDRKIEIYIATEDSNFHFFKNKRIKLIKIKARNFSGGTGYATNADYAKEVTNIYKGNKFDIVVFKNFFPLNFVKLTANDGAKKILILTSFHERSFNIFLNLFFYKFFDYVLMPKDVDDFKERYAKELNKKLHSNKFVPVDFLTGKIEAGDKNWIEKKYKINKNDFIIVMNAGGGGLLNAKKREIEKIFPIFNEVSKDLLNIDDRIKVIIIKGKYLKIKDEKNCKDRIICVDFEERFLELLKTADIFVSHCGYGNINSILKSRVPSVVFPLKRGLSDDQYARARKLSKIKCAIVLKELSREVLLKKIISLRKNTILDFKKKLNNLNKRKNSCSSADFLFTLING